ncbi:hypothetical protein [Emticicia agri]|uniref:Uncharacterized protein n=1 Tax=Emticicia agri TaxID=2492393 RepID=A0A4Q5M2G1_9BACT|nr:hypothetical protein [Emticicia agri]RYU96033.1 hypothetical protein EWM59_09040 [Emticicia agri]
MTKITPLIYFSTEKAICLLVNGTLALASELYKQHSFCKYTHKKTKTSCGKATGGFQTPNLNKI